MARGGVETLSAAFNWSVIQPYANAQSVPAAQRARFHPEGGVPTDFSSSDQLVRSAASAGMRTLPVLVHAPGWARRDPGLEWSPPADPARYAGFTAAMVRRYGSSGSFWIEHPKLRRLPIRAWQVWNEPSAGDVHNTQSIYWAEPDPTEQNYVTLLHAAHDAIKQADPSAQVLVGGLLGRSWLTLQLIYDRGGRPYFDAIALHPYTAQPQDVVHIVDLNRTVADQAGDAAKPMILSEMGWPPFNRRQVARKGFKQTSAIQAGWAQEALRSLLSARRRLNIAGIVWYGWLGHDSAPDDAFDYSGLNHLDRRGRVTPKPALAVFRQIARGAEGR